MFVRTIIYAKCTNTTKTIHTNDDTVIPRIMSTRRCKQTKRKLTAKEQLVNNNVLSYKRGEEVINCLVFFQRQKQLLSTGRDKEKPICVNYGPDCKRKYPGMFCCSNCRNWDNCPVENKQLKQTMKKFS